MSTIKKALFDINVCIRLFLMNDNSEVLSIYCKLFEVNNAGCFNKMCSEILIVRGWLYFLTTAGVNVCVKVDI